LEVSWNRGRYYLRNVLPLKTHPIWQLHANPMEKDTMFHYSGMDGSVQLFDLRSGEIKRTISLPSQNFPVLAVNKSCTRLVISTKKGVADFAIEEYNFETGELLRTLSGHQGWITCLKFLDDNRVISGSQDHSIKLWNLESGECERDYIGHSAFVTCVQVHRISKSRNPNYQRPFLISGAHDGDVRLWDINTGHCWQTFRCRVPISALHADGELVIATGCGRENRTTEKGSLKLWDIERAKLVHDFAKEVKGGKGLAPMSGVYLCDDRLLTVESGWMNFRCRKFRKTGAIRLWDTTTGAMLAKIADFQVKEHANKSQCVVSMLVDKDKNVILGIEEMEHIKPSSFSHIFKIKSMVKVWSVQEGRFG